MNALLFHASKSPECAAHYMDMTQLRVVEGKSIILTTLHYMELGEKEFVVMALDVSSSLIRVANFFTEERASAFISTQKQIHK